MVLVQLIAIPQAVQKVKFHLVKEHFGDDLAPLAPPCLHPPYLYLQCAFTPLSPQCAFTPLLLHPWCALTPRCLPRSVPRRGALGGDALPLVQEAPTRDQGTCSAGSPALLR